MRLNKEVKIMKIQYISSEGDKVVPLKFGEVSTTDNDIVKVAEEMCKLYNEHEVIFSRLTDIGVFNLFSNGVLTNSNGITIIDVPLDRDAYNDAIFRSILLYGDCDFQMMSYELLVEETNNNICVCAN